MRPATLADPLACSSSPLRLTTRATGRHLLDELNQRTPDFAAKSLNAVLVVSTEVRLALRRFLEPSFPRLSVLAFQELPAATEIENAGIVPLPAGLARREGGLKAAA